MARLTDEDRCPKCGSKVVGQHRDEENVLVDLWTACGSEWHSEDSMYVSSVLDKDVGWSHNSHACSLILGLMADKEGAEHDRDATREALTQVQTSYTAVVRELERAVRMLVGYGMTEYAARAALNVQEPTDG